MTTHPADPAGARRGPSACPAHGPGGIRRLFGPEAESDPIGLYEQLRAEYGPVAPVLVHGDLPAWLVLGYRENLDVTRNPARFSRDPRLWRDMKEGRVAPDHPLAPIAAWQPLCNFVDGDEHTRLRGAVTDSLARFDRRGIRRHVTRFANQLVDRFAADGHADIVSQFAEHLPMLVMAQLLGMPEQYGPRLLDSARDMLKGTATAVASNEHIMRTLQELVARKRTASDQDLASWLIEHPAGLTDGEVQQHLRLVLIAAFETTANLITNTVRMVLTDTRFRASLAGGHMTLPDGLEQSLWDEPPLMTILGRWATGSTTLAGKRVNEGDMLLLGLAAGNVDPVIRPDLSVAVHGNRSHLAFSSGPHECPGQDIGRAVADTGIDVLLTRLPDLSLGVHESQLRWVASLMSRHLVALPVEFTPVRPARAAAEGAALEEPRRSRRSAAMPPAGRRPPNGASDGSLTAGGSLLTDGSRPAPVAQAAPSSPAVAPAPPRDRAVSGPGGRRQARASRWRKLLDWLRGW